MPPLPLYSLTVIIEIVLLLIKGFRKLDHSCVIFHFSPSFFSELPSQIEDSSCAVSALHVFAKITVGVSGLAQCEIDLKLYHGSSVEISFLAPVLPLMQLKYAYT